MKRFLKILILSLVFYSFSLYSQVNRLNREVYSIGTGVSFNYFDNNVGFVIDSYHFFNSENSPSNKGFLKVGAGVNYDAISEIENAMGFLANVSVGYMYIVENMLTDTLYNFGSGFTIDYTYASLDTHLIGATLYLTLNEAILGLGTGFILTGVSQFSPYARLSLGIVF